MVRRYCAERSEIPGTMVAEPFPSDWSDRPTFGVIGFLGGGQFSRVMRFLRQDPALSKKVSNADAGHYYVTASTRTGKNYAEANLNRDLTLTNPFYGLDFSQCRRKIRRRSRLISSYTKQATCRVFRPGNIASWGSFCPRLLPALNATDTTISGCGPLVSLFALRAACSGAQTAKRCHSPPKPEQRPALLDHCERP